MKFHFGLPLMLGIVALWGVPALIRTNGDFFRIGIGRHVVSRSLSAMEGHGSSGWLMYSALLPFYFVTIFASFFPWSLWLPRVISFYKKAEHRGAAEAYLISGVLLTFVIFTPLSTKLPHYTLPAFPLLAILFARWLEHRGARFFTRVCLAMICLNFVAGFVLAPIVARYFPAPRLVREAAPWLKPEMEFASVDFQEPSLVWYFRGRIRSWHQMLKPDEAMTFMQKPGARCCVLPASLAAQLQPDLTWKRLTAEGINVANGKSVHLTLWIKES